MRLMIMRTPLSLHSDLRLDVAVERLRERTLNLDLTFHAQPAIP